jgi:hypothetical protein
VAHEVDLLPLSPGDLELDEQVLALVDDVDRRLSGDLLAGLGALHRLAAHAGGLAELAVAALAADGLVDVGLALRLAGLGSGHRRLPAGHALLEWGQLLLPLLHGTLEWGDLAALGHRRAPLRAGALHPDPRDRSRALAEPAGLCRGLADTRLAWHRLSGDGRGPLLGRLLGRLLLVGRRSRRQQRGRDPLSDGGQRDRLRLLARRLRLGLGLVGLLGLQRGLTGLEAGQLGRDVPDLGDLLRAQAGLGALLGLVGLGDRVLHPGLLDPLGTECRVRLVHGVLLASPRMGAKRGKRRCAVRR